MTQTEQWTVEDEIEAGIKPCPKCGAKATLEGVCNDQIVCNGCGMWSGEDYDDLDAAIEWWNQQPLIDELQAEIARLQAELAAREAQLARQWQPVNPVSMANDEYADAEIMLCYRRTHASKE